MKKILILIAIIAVPAFAQQEFSQEYIKPAGNFSEIYIECAAGRIYCEPAEGKDIELYVKKLVYLDDDEDARELADDCRVRFNETGRAIELIVDLPRRGYSRRGILDKIFDGGRNEDLEIQIKALLPADIDIKIETASADVFISNLSNSNIDVNGSSSDISLENVKGNCFLNVSSGDLEAFQVDGNLDLSGSSSDFDIADVSGNIRVSTSSGDGIVENVNGDLEIKTSSGDIRFYNVKGNLYTHSTSGDITGENIGGSVRTGSTSGRIGLKRLSNPEAGIIAESTSGDIYLEITDRFTGDFDFATHSGRIDSQFEMSLGKFSRNHLTGTIGSGDGRIEVETTSGDIVVETY